MSALLIGSSFHFFFVSVHGTSGGVSGPENRARNYSLVSLGGASGFAPVFATNSALLIASGAFMRRKNSPG